MIKTQYKSNVFSMLFENVNYCLEVYNALNGSSYDDPEAVSVERLENGISLSIRNDASFIIENNLNIYEQQATYNPNMPLRSLIYFVEIVKPLIKDNDIHSRKLMKIPNPKFVVFYNGTEERPEVEELYLSDAYYNKEENPSLEARCIVYNINVGSNDTFLSKCKIMREYMIFVNVVREQTDKGETIDKAIDYAIKYCIGKGILYDFLSLRGNEVRDVAALDYTFERRVELIKKEYYDDGIKAGIEQGIDNTQHENVLRMAEIGMSTEQIAKCLGITEEKVTEWIS